MEQIPDFTGIMEDCRQLSQSAQEMQLDELQQCIQDHTQRLETRCAIHNPAVLTRQQSRDLGKIISLHNRTIEILADRKIRIANELQKLRRGRDMQNTYIRKKPPEEMSE